MRRQWPCSKCGFACSSTWRSSHSCKPVICNTCKSKERKNNIVVSNPPPKQVLVNGTEHNLSKTSSLDWISPSGSVMHENVGVRVGQIGMIFGNLPFQPTLASPPNVHNQVKEPNLQPKVEVVADDHCYPGTSLKTSTSVLRDGVIQIKQEYDCEEQTLSGGGKPSIWDQKKVQKKKRSKLPQYTLSPLARFIKQLQYHVTLTRPNANNTLPAAEYAYNNIQNQLPKYDDVLIYEKCKYIADNEIGLGAMLLSPPVMNGRSYKADQYSSASTVGVEAESSSTDESDAFSNCLIDVPVRSSSSK